MQAHCNDLRDEIANDWNTLIDDARTPDDTVLDAFTHQTVTDWRKLAVTPAVMAMLEYAEKVTQTPAACNEADIHQLRDCGWSDAAIHDAVQVVGYFNYINRVADALGVEPEPEPTFGRWGRQDRNKTV